MMSGAVILLLGAIARGFAPEERMVGWLQNLSLIAGYFLLAYGFWLSHRARRDAIQRAAQQRDKDHAREAESVLAAHDPPQDGAGN